MQSCAGLLLQTRDCFYLKHMLCFRDDGILDPSSDREEGYSIDLNHPIEPTFP